MLGVGRPGQLGAAVEQGGAVERGEQPLVRVDHERVGPLDRRRSAAGRSARPAPRRRRRRRRGTRGRGRRPRRPRRPGRRRCRRWWCRRWRPPRTGRRSRSAVGRSSPSRVAARASPVSRPRSSTGASITSMSMTRAVEAIDEWASAEATMRQRAGRSSPAAARASAAAWRAATSALRLPAEPPDTKHPPADGGQAGQVGDPAQGLVLGVHRAGALEPRAAVDRRRADHQVEQGRRLGRGRRHERQRPRVVLGDARRGQHLDPQPQRLGAAQARRA